MFVWFDAAKRLEAIEADIHDGLEGTPAAGLTAKQVHVLNALYAKDGMHASKLAAAVGTASTSFTPILDGLQNAGFVLRRPDPADRRAVLIYLTANGEALKPSIEKVLHVVEGKFTEHKTKPTLKGLDGTATNQLAERA